MAVDSIVWKIILDFLILICLGLPVLAIELQWVQPYRRGFFEDDLTIKLPFKEQSVTELMTSFAVVLVIFTILLLEIVRDKRGKGIGSKFVCGRLVPGWVWETYSGVGVFLFGLACQHLLTFTSKCVIGRLRPHFYEVCMPVYNTSAPLSHGYVQDYSCAQTNARLVREAHMSFPSGHSSYALYCAVFFMLYVQVRGKWRRSKLLRHGIQFAVLLAAWYVGLTRVQEHYHFWSDVAVGSIIGGFIAVMVFFYVLEPKKYVVPRGVWDRESAPQNVLPRPVLAR